MTKEWLHFREYSSLKRAENGCKTATRTWAGVVDTKIEPIRNSRLGGTRYSVWAQVDRDLSRKIVAERRVKEMATYREKIMGDAKRLIRLQDEMEQLIATLRTLKRMS